MKKIIFGLLLSVLAVSAYADGPWHHGEYRGGYHGGIGWVAPLAIGGIIGYELGHTPPPVYVAPPTYVIAPPPPVYLAPQSTIRFYCPSTQGYYPDVQTCDQPWLRTVQ